MRSRLKSVLAIGMCLVVSIPACAFRPRQAPPAGLRSYLDALVEGRLSDAYEVTQLADVHEAFGAGSAVSLEHFEATWTDLPLQRYEVIEVVELRRREIADFGEGSPYFETQVRMITSLGSRLELIAVDGKINPTVQIDPLPVRFEGVVPKVPVRVDGVLVSAPRRSHNLTTLLLLPGRHDTRFGTENITLELEPLSVIEGNATVSDPVGRVVSLS